MWMAVCYLLLFLYDRRLWQNRRGLSAGQLWVSVCLEFGELASLWLWFRGPLAWFSHVCTNMFDRRRADMFGHVCLFGSGGPLACLVMFKQTCWELWSLLHMAHWHVYILFDSLTCTMTCQVKQMIGIVSWAKVPWQKLQTKVVSTSCFEMSWWGSLEAKYFFYFFFCCLDIWFSPVMK